MFQNSFLLTKVFGIRIEISYSWFLVFFLVSTNLYYVFQGEPYFLSSAGAIFTAVLTALMFFTSVLFHELSHSIVAKRLGINVPKITLFIFGGMAQIEKDADTPSKEFKIAIAGPVSSLFLSVLFGSAYYYLQGSGLSEGLVGPLMWLSVVNFTLAIFNLVPGYPMDGGRLFKSVIWHFNRNVEKATKYASFVGQMFAAFLMISGTIIVLNGGITGLWFILIGWFLNTAAAGSYQQMVISRKLDDLKVQDIMSDNVIAVSRDETLAHMIDEYFFRFKLSRLPVVDHNIHGAIDPLISREKLVGMITTKDLNKVPRESWSEVKVEDVMERIPEEMLISPDQKVLDALIGMSEKGYGHLLVTRNDDLVGIVTRKDIFAMIHLKSELGR